MFKNKKNLTSIVWASLYFVLITAICVSGVILFNKYYYSVFFVDGDSMSPTINNHEPGKEDRNDFGIVDCHASALNNLQRFDIVTAYYAEDYLEYGAKKDKDGHKILKTKDNIKPGEKIAEPKIKRLLGFPGEKLDFVYTPFEDDKYYFYINGKKTEIPYTHNERFNPRRHTHFELGEDEYFLMGDNWYTSLDCSSEDINKVGKINKENLIGVLIAIQGTCKIDPITNKPYDLQYSTPRYFK